MIDRAEAVHTCPDCGGILLAPGVERLTTAEVAAADDDDGAVARTRQCLLCGYEERVPEAEPVANPR
jgi:hypothetical protein